MSATGVAGTALIFGDCLVHGSPPNCRPGTARSSRSSSTRSPTPRTLRAAGLQAPPRFDPRGAARRRLPRRHAGGRRSMSLLHQGYFTAALAEADPRDRDGGRRRTRAPAGRHRADRLGEHRQPRRARGAGLDPHQQDASRAIRASAITPAPPMSTSSSAPPSSAPAQLFGCRFANVQPHSGSQANHAVLHALAKPGDTILSWTLTPAAT